MLLLDPPSLLCSCCSQARRAGRTPGVLLFKKIFEIAPEALGLFSFKDEEDVYNSPKLKAHALS